MPESRTETKRTEPLRLARTESIVEARPKPEIPGAEEMFLSPRVLDAGAFARYAETLRALIGDARQGARDLQDFAADADQMAATCQKTGEQLRTRLEAGARVVKMIDERADRAERILDTVRSELPSPDRVRAMVEPAVRAAIDDAQARAAEVSLQTERNARAAAAEIEKSARATAAEIEEKLAAMTGRAEQQAARLEQAGQAIEQRLDGLETRLASLMDLAETAAKDFEARTNEAVRLAEERLTPVLQRATEAGRSIDDTLAAAWRHAEERAGHIGQRLGPLQEACDAVLDRLGLDPVDPDPAGSVLHRLDDLVRRSEASISGAEKAVARVDSLREQAEGAKSDFGAWLLEAAAQLDELEIRRERLAGPLAAAAEKVARISPKIADDLEIASKTLDQLQSEQAILREAVQASAALARGASSELNNQSAQLKALVDGSVLTLSKRVEEAGMWLGQLILRAEAAAAGLGSPMPVASPAPAAPTAPASITPAPVERPQRAEAPLLTAEPAATVPAPTPRRPIEPPANSYGLPMPPSLPIDALSFDGADVVFGQGDEE